MNWKAVSRNVGTALLVSALFMFISAMVSLAYEGDTSMGPLLVSSLITFLVGIFPFIFVAGSYQISLKEGYVIIVLSWLLSFVFGMLPYALWGGPFTIENAWFESVSGFTTTGSTILDDIESIPKGLLFWRSSTHFIGGLGVVVFLLLIIPGASPIKLRLRNMEMSALSEKSYSTRSNKTVYIFAYVYLGIFAAAFVAYVICGMSVFDAVNHAMSVCATGGFSTRNFSIASFHSPAIEAVSLFFMLLSSLHFGLIYYSLISASLKPLKNPVIKFYLITLLVFSIASGLSIKISGAPYSFGKSLWYGTFQVVSMASSTGFAIADNAHWSPVTNILVSTMAVMCGCAGSTTGGIKADRALVLFKSVRVAVFRFLHPSSVNEVKLGRRFLRAEEVSSHLLYIILFFAILVVSTLLAILTGIDEQNSLIASLSSLSNVGPAVRDLGNFGNYSHIPNATKFLLTMDMFLGRVEIYPILAVFAMIFNRDSKR